MILFFFGDSLTMGVNDPEMLGWPGRVCRLAAARGASFDFFNLGVRRQSTQLIKARWLAETSPRLPEGGIPAFIFCCGAVDAARNLDFDEAITGLRQMLTAARALGQCLFLTPPPLADPGAAAREKSLAAAFKGVCTDLDVPCLDLFGSLAERPDYLQDLRDGLHPGAAGYAIIAGLVDAWPVWRGLFEPLSPAS